MSALAAALSDFQPKSPVAVALESEPERRKRVLGIEARVHQKKSNAAFDLKKKELRRLIKPENADFLVEALPLNEGDRTHAILPGDFVFGDFIEAVVAKRGFPRRLMVATLSMSEKNVAGLERIAAGAGAGAGAGVPVLVLVSCYFQKTNKAIFRALMEAAGRQPSLSVSVARSHCKVTLFDYADAALVVEGSANLRSSVNFEQVTVLNDRELLEMHAGFMEEAGTAPGDE